MVYERHCFTKKIPVGYGLCFVFSMEKDILKNEYDEKC